MKLRREILIALIVPLTYLIIALFTISDYGVSIDEPAHFRRGQGYLHFFLTGKKDYKDLPENVRKSAYQDNFETGGLYINAQDQSHPPLNGTLAALTNYIFYQKLGIIGDVEGHHLFGIFSVTLLILGVYTFTRLNFGIFPALVASLSILLYPIFFAESHFNVKDPPQSSFFALTIISFWLGMNKKQAKYIIASAFFTALALGTKFNIVFLPFILLPWFFSYGKELLKLQKRMYISFLLFPVIITVVFFLSNPNLWVDPITRVSNMIDFYLSSGTKIGGSPDYQPQFLLNGFNTYAILAIIYSTPLVTLLLSIIGILTAVRRFITTKNRLYLLILVWFFFPILRVTVPGATIYGGIRHIFEFIPAMAILVGIGVSELFRLSKIFNKQKNEKKNKLRMAMHCLLLISFIPIAVKFVAIHPNQNVYFNPLIGGLKGAMEKNFPLAGNSLGNTYLQGAKWLNTHAEKDACITTPLAHLGDIPPHALRADLRFINACQSGLARLGEYAMDMTYPDYFNTYYAYAYYTTYVRPVHQITVDGVVIFEIYKNDLTHAKKELIKETVVIPQEVVQQQDTIKITLQNQMVLSRLNLYYDIPPTCTPISDGFVIISVDGKTWKREPDNIAVSLGKELVRPYQKKIERRFTAKKGKYIQLHTNLDKNCKMEIKKTEVFIHPDAY